ncbi:hypothetical protein FQN54_006092 [Arachnomyces sp. PD_36]|nr:hypothetical protein FQN54_006092 [Arachnomyces sp. PD_36]
MLVSKIFTGAIMAVMSVTALAAATPQQIADGLKSITQKSQELQGPAQSITVVNAPLIVIGKGPFPEIIAGFTDIVSTATTLASQMGSSAERRRAVTDTADADSDLIFNAFHEFTRVMQALLNILIGKAGILQEIPIVGGPVAAVLRSVESIIDVGTLEINV